jgi:hypothetical protein
MQDRVIKYVLSRTPRTIRDKSECYALYEAGLFGNKARTWDSYTEIIESCWTGRVCMRSKKGIDRTKVVYNLTLEEAKRELRRWNVLGINEDQISFNQNMPDKHLLLQGEVKRTEYGLWLRYTTIKKPMNQALKEEDKNCTGLSAKTRLEQALDPSSYSDLEALLEMFPDSVVEFSTYSVDVGNISRRNTVFWEVRNF